MKDSRMHLLLQVQVIAKALALWGLELTPLHSTDKIATDIRSNPTKGQAYVRNPNPHKPTCRNSMRINRQYLFFFLMFLGSPIP